MYVGDLGESWDAEAMYLGDLGESWDAEAMYLGDMGEHFLNLAEMGYEEWVDNSSFLVAAEAAASAAAAAAAAAAEAEDAMNIVNDEYEVGPSMLENDGKEE